MKVAFFGIKEEWEKKEILKVLPQKDVKFFSENLQEISEKDLRGVDVISVFVGCKCSADNLKRVPKLKFIATRSTGFDHIDLTYCKKNNIRVGYVPFYGENTVAEFTFGLLINIARKIDFSVKRVKTGSFDFLGLKGFDLKSRTIGILGFGHIGQKFAKMCKGFDMNVIAYDPFADKLVDVANNLGVKMVSFNEVLKKSDVISIHMPLLPQTKHILNKKAFDMMKKGVILLNTSRGGLINTKDLIAALDSGKVGFAGLDVLEAEDELKDQKMFIETNKKNLQTYKLIIQNHELIRRHNVFVTPHNAFNTQDALERIMSTTLGNILAYKNKKEIPYLVKVN